MNKNLMKNYKILHELTRFWWQRKNKRNQHRYHHQWQNQVGQIKQRSPLDIHSKCDIRVGFWATEILQNISLGRSGR
jgi:hypothetical protein